MSEMIRIARSTLLLDDLIPKMNALFKRMLNQGADRKKIVNQYKKAKLICQNFPIKMKKKENVMLRASNKFCQRT